MTPNTITHWINNKPFPGTSGAAAPVTNPANAAVTPKQVTFQRVLWVSARFACRVAGKHRATQRN
jgi:hypothetical protein